VSNSSQVHSSSSALVALASTLIVTGDRKRKRKQRSSEEGYDAGGEEEEGRRTPAVAMQTPLSTTAKRVKVEAAAGPAPASAAIAAIASRAAAALVPRRTGSVTKRGAGPQQLPSEPFLEQGGMQNHAPRHEGLHHGVVLVVRRQEEAG
jgi:hypothetical protein